MKFSRTAIAKTVSLLMANKTFVLYVIIGGIALLIELATYIMLNALGARIEISNAAGMALGMVTSFTLNSRYNFQVSDRLVRRFASFVTITLVSYFGSTLLLVALVSGLHANAVLAKIVTLPLVLLVQFTINKRFTFNEAKQSS